MGTPKGAVFRATRSVLDEGDGQGYPRDGPGTVVVLP